MPWHFYAAGICGVVWGAFSVLRFFAFQLGMLGTSAIADLQLVPFLDLPMTITAAWAMCSIGALAGAVFLLLRSRWAVQAFTISLVGLMATSLYQFGMVANPISIYDMPINFAVWVIALLSLHYASRAHAHGLLN